LAPLLSSYSLNYLQIKIKEFKMAANARPKIVSEKPVEDQTKS
jgi:hypothetical protein